MKLLRTLVMLGSVFITFGCHNAKVAKKQPQASAQKPNIIYILADDLGYGDLGVYGQTKIETPNIDALAKEGILFTQHYTAAPVCAPARASLLTGLHGGHASIRGNDEWEERGNVWNYRAMIADSTLEGQRPMPKSTVTLAQTLKKASYKTGIVGKWGLGAPQTESIPTEMGFDYFFGYNCQRQAHTYTPVHLYENEKRVYLNNDTIAPHEGLAKGSDAYDLQAYAKFTQPDYSPTLIFDKMMAFIEKNKKEPFFMYWASPIPHVPLQAPQNWVDYYVNKFGDEEPHHFIEGEGADYFPTRYPRATYAAMISYLDENVGKLVSYLKKEGLYENTLIVFTSDNGPSSAGGGDAVWFDSAAPFDSSDGRGKGFLYEGGIRVPLIATWPGKIQPGTTSDHISAFYDIMPTFNEVAQVDTTYASDGISFYNALTNAGKQDQHDYLYWEFAGYSGQVAVRMGKWKMIWKDIKKGNKTVELYDLDADIREQHNIMDQHPEMLKTFYDIVKKEHSAPENKSFSIEGVEQLVSQHQE